MEFSRVMFLTSNEVFLVNEKLKEIKENFIKKHLDFNYKEIEKEINADILKEEIETYPLMSEKKMIVLKTIKEDEKMAELMKNIPEYCTLVIIGNLDKRKKLYKTIKKVGKILELESYNEVQMVDWVIKKCKELGSNITKKCAKKIIDFCGIDDMYNIYTELIKLVNMKEKITEELIEKVVSKSVEYDSFELVNAISKKDKKKAYEIIHNLSEKNEYFPQVVSLISRNFAILKMMQTMKNDEIKNTAGIHPYTLKILGPFVKKFNEDELDRYMSICQEIDFDMKNGVDHRIALEKLIGVIE